MRRSDRRGAKVADQAVSAAHGLGVLLPTSDTRHDCGLARRKRRYILTPGCGDRASFQARTVQAEWSGRVRCRRRSGRRLGAALRMSSGFMSRGEWRLSRRQLAALVGLRNAKHPES